MSYDPTNEVVYIVNTALQNTPDEIALEFSHRLLCSRNYFKLVLASHESKIHRIRSTHAAILACAELCGQDVRATEVVAPPEWLHQVNWVTHRCVKHTLLLTLDMITKFVRPMLVSDLEAVGDAVTLCLCLQSFVEVEPSNVEGCYAMTLSGLPWASTVPLDEVHSIT